MIQVYRPNTVFNPELDLRCHFNKGGGDSRSDTRYQRTGTSITVAGHDVPSDIISLLSAAREAVAIPGTDTHAALIDTLLARSPDDVVGKAQLEEYLDVDPSGFAWYTNIQNIAQQDPYSATYEANTQAAFVQRVEDLLAELDSSTLRVGFNHAALLKGEAVSRATIRRSEDLARQRQVDVQAAIGASQVLLTLEQIVFAHKAQVAGYIQQAKLANYDQGLNAGSQRTQRVIAQTTVTGLETNMRSSETRTTTDNLVGRGTQAQSYGNWQAGISCCFIFLQALNGELPLSVRLGRIEFGTDQRMRGYKRMSRWLVPLMRRSKAVAHIVNTIMIKPFLRWGGWLYREQGAKPKDARWEPVCRLWFRVWDYLG